MLSTNQEDVLKLRRLKYKDFITFVSCMRQLNAGLDLKIHSQIYDYTFKLTTNCRALEMVFVII